MGLRRVALGALLCVLAAAIVPAVASATTTGIGTYSDHGYITMADGVKLHYDVEIAHRPAPGERFPAMLNYTYYAPGEPVTGTGDSTTLSRSTLLDQGYALVGVTVRGAGCSGGTFDLFDPNWSTDGYRVVEWIAAQPWSDGKVGMYGTSGPGILQWMVAGARPPHLTAITPYSTVGDLYRDVGAPGGLKNVLFAGIFEGEQNAQAAGGVVLNAEDPQCVLDFGASAPANPTHTGVWYLATRSFDDPFLQARSPDRYFPSVNVPALTFQQWQDEQLMTRLVRRLGELPAKTTWSVASNGNHAFQQCAECETMTYAFLAHYLKGADNGWERTPHYQIWEDTSGTGTAAKKSWAIDYASWPPRVDQLTLSLHGGGLLSSAPTVAASASDSYAYPRLSSGGTDAANGSAAWQVRDVPGGYLEWTTAPFAADRVLYSASLNLWLASTATDADLQATLSEISPQGNETYVQRGWLRASHRALDPKTSTATQPEQTHLASDYRPLVPGRPTYMRLGFFDFSVAVRRGWRLRVILDAPTAPTGLWQFIYDTTPSTYTVFEDQAHPSALVVGVLPGQRAQAPAPACMSLTNQPCRAAAGSLPRGLEPAVPQWALQAGCPAPSGGLRGRSIGPASLGLTRAQARRVFAHVRTRRRPRMDFFCLAGSGIRAGYVRGRVALLLTANPRYALRSVSPGDSLGAARRRLRLIGPLRVGANDWYLAPDRAAVGVLKVRRGIVREVGIASAALTRTRRADLAFLRSFD